MPSLNDLLYDIRRIAEHREVLTEKKIKAMYRSLTDDLDAFLAKTYKKYADGDGRLYMGYLDAQNARARFLQEIIENVDGLTPELKKTIGKLIDDTYTETYKGMYSALKDAEDLERFKEITKDLNVNPEALRQAVNNNISKLTLDSVLEQHRGAVIYQIQQELNIGLMRGDRYERIAKRISERVGVSQSKAMNITRTETHRNIESGFMNGAINASEHFAEYGLIYAATWRTREDERVRPQTLRKTKKGWVAGRSKNGANHMIMEGVTVKAGEMFDLGDGAKAINPGESGEARHDCNCRCFIEYNTLTAEEFAEMTGQTAEAVKAKYKIGQTSEAQTEYMFPEATDEKEAAVYKEIQDTYNQLYKKYGVSVDLVGDKTYIDQIDWDNALQVNVDEYLKKHPTVGRKRAETYVKKSMYERPEKADVFLGGEYWDNATKVNTDGSYTRIKKINVNRFEIGFTQTFKEGEEYVAAKIAKKLERIKQGKRARGISNATEGGTGTMLHEYGHALDYAKGIRTHPKFKEWYSTLTEDEIQLGLSTYATTNEKEFIAEAFAESFYKHQRPLSKKFMEILEEILND